MGWPLDEPQLVQDKLGLPEKAINLVVSGVEPSYFKRIGASSWALSRRLRGVCSLGSADSLEVERHATDLFRRFG